MCAISALHASTVLVDTLPESLPFGGTSLNSSPLSSSFDVTEGESWSIESITLNIGQGSQADMFVQIKDEFDVVRGTSSVTPLTIAFSFLETAFLFSTPAELTAGTYFIVSNYTITGTDNTSFWNNTAGHYRIEGASVSSIPEPATYAVILGMASLCGVAVRRRSRAG